MKSIAQWPCRLLALALGALLFAPLLAAAQADYGREKRWAAEIAPMILFGDPVYLELKSGHKFLAIHTPSAKPLAGVITVHGSGVHPDHGLLNPLRSDLAEQGYTTLSIQMPVLASEARGDEYSPLFPEAAERLQAAVAFLRARGLKKIAIVSHSMGSRMSNFFFNTVAESGVDVWVAIGISGEFTQPATIRVPVLDIYGDKDLPAVMDNAGKRAAAISQLRGSGQVRVAGADHFFTGVRDELVRQVKRFLDARLK